jgi:hypothetical protein
MKRFMILAVFLVLVAVVQIATSTRAQEKSWKEWSKKDAEKILSKSPWAHLQVDTDLSEMFYQPTHSSARAPNANSRLEEGATNQETKITYGIRFFSARPIRQAFVRMLQLEQKPDAATNERLTAFAEVVSDNSIIIAVTVEGTDKRSLGKVNQIINSANLGTLKNSTYLERRDGKRNFIEEYHPPGKDGFGARFIFLRNMDEKPFLDANSGDVRFVSEFSSGVKLNMLFKVSDMMLDGKLEY